ncbi:PLAC8-domain-containing protein [Jackrogersella minutella]|nr:PLAC8-domain-containing protein [Jackrogersella minutella]
MDTQEKFLYLGPDTPQGSEPQHQQPMMQGQPPVGAYTQQPQVQPQPQAQLQSQSQLQFEPQPYPQVEPQTHPLVQQAPYPHPTAYGQQGGPWQAGICDCAPLIGQTSERIRDPSMQSADMMNSDCMIYGLITCFTGCGWIYALMKRAEIRERYKIEGSGTSDCCVSYWCPCCALIQQDNEVKGRQRNVQPVAQGYQSQPAMQMPMPSPSYQP